MRWIEHLERTTDTGNTYRVLMGNLNRSDNLENLGLYRRITLKLTSNKEYVCVYDGVEFVNVSQNTVQWLIIANTVIKLVVPTKVENSNTI
jgi:hypothetical protein